MGASTIRSSLRWAERFAPDRLAGYPPFSLIGFGGTHERCLGINFAAYELKIVLT